MKTRWYVLIGSIMILVALAIANVASAAELYNSGNATNALPWAADSSSYYWYEPANTGGGFNEQTPFVTLSATATWFRMKTATDTCPLYNSIRATGGGIGTPYGSSDTPVPDANGYCDWEIAFGGIPAGTSLYALQGDAYHAGQSVYGSTSNTGNSFYSSQALIGSGGPYFAIYSSTPTPPTTDDTTRIISVTPSGEATTSPVALTMQYYASATSSVPWDTAEVTLYDLETGITQVLYSTTSAATGTITTWAASSSLVLPDGLYRADWSLSSSESYLFVVPTSTTFVVGTSTLSTLLSLATSDASTTCSITDIVGCFQSALAWAFEPSPTSMQLLAQASNALYTAPPVGYWKAYKDTIVIAFSTTTASTLAVDTMGTSSLEVVSDFMEETPYLHEGLVALYWAAFSIFFYAGTIRLIHAVL